MMSPRHEKDGEESTMMWYNNPSAVKAISEAKRERGKRRTERNLRMIDGR